MVRAAPEEEVEAAAPLAVPKAEEVKTSENVTTTAAPVESVPHASE
jgi:hypothetical protein